MTTDDEGVILMDIVEDILTAEHEKIDEIWEKARHQKMTA